jgi:hypothetical protein
MTPEQLMKSVTSNIARREATADDILNKMSGLTFDGWNYRELLRQKIAMALSREYLLAVKELTFAMTETGGNA